MAFELISARILAPTFGSTLHVWGSVIGVTLFSLSLGYYLGGYIASQNKGDNILYRLLLSAGFFIGFITLIAQPFILFFKNSDPIASVIITSLVLFSVPNILLGMVPSILVSMLGQTTHETGGSAGKIYSVSSTGGIISCFCNGFFIIPHFGLIQPAIFTGIFLSIIPFVIFIKRKKKTSILFLVSIFLLLYSNQKNSERGGIKLLHKSEGLLGQILVADFPSPRPTGIMGRDRILLVNRMGQTWVRLEDMNSRWSYGNYIVSLTSVLPPDSKVLLLGLGGGTVAKLLTEQNKFQVEAVELDSRITDISRKYFKGDTNVITVIDDARHFIQTCNKKYDLIVFDIFKGETPPSHVLTLECFRETQKILNPEGMVIVNFNGFITEKVEGLALRSLLTTFRASGFQVNVAPTYEEPRQRNTLLIGSFKKQDAGKMKISLNTFYPQINFSNLFFPIEEINLNDGILLTDNNPVLEILNIPAAQKWREDYTKNFTVPFGKKGVPLF